MTMTNDLPHFDRHNISAHASNAKVELSDRVIGDRSDGPGPNVVFFGGIHGNEPSGVLALQQVFEMLGATGIKIHGRVLGLAGNLPALASDQRFIDKDLNRLWNADFTARYDSQHQSKVNDEPVEYQQQYELFKAIKPILESDDKNYFLDLHTTSSKSIPFIGINDQLNNRNFALQFPVATVLGLEEYLDGPLLSYLNELGHVALAFEAGQHDARESIELHREFILRSLRITGVIDEMSFQQLDNHQSQSIARLDHSEQKERGIYEVTHRHEIAAQDRFKMLKIFKNFQRVSRKEPVAKNHDETLLAPHSGRIFMPLYQGAGNDGFFIVRKVPLWALKLSKVLRKINFERFLLILPGVSRRPEYPDALVVNQKIAFLLATQIFHLLGYRRKKKQGTQLIFSRREITH